MIEICVKLITSRFPPNLHLRNMWQRRRCHTEVFCKNAVLKDFAKFTGKHVCHNLFFNKFETEVCNFFRNEILAQVSSCGFSEIFQNTYLQKTFVGCFCSKYSYIYVLFLVKCIICKGVVSSETFHICATSYFVFAKLVKPFPRIMFFLVPSIIIMKKVLKNHINSSVSLMIHFLVQLSTRMLLMDFIIMMQLSLK